MALYLIDNAIVNNDTVIIKFGRTIKISSLVNDCFVVATDAATPQIVPSPFKDIESLIDYNQISRTLTLYWKKILASNTPYTITLVNLLDSSGSLIPEETIKFTSSQASATPSYMQEPRGTIVNEVLISDKSVRVDIDSGYQIIAKNPHFYIESIDPPNGSFFVDDSETNGRVKITFNERPASNFINSKYFKAQRKKIQRTPARWQTLTANISMHSWKPEVYIDFPSLDAAPSYFTEDKYYYESGYKYRIIVSSEVGI